MKNKIRTWYNHNPKEGREKGGGKSLTVPDQTLPLQTLLERFTRGQSVATLTPVYQDTDEFPDFDRMDKVEIEQYKNNLSASLKDAQKRQKQPKVVAPQPPPIVEDIEGV